MELKAAGLALCAIVLSAAAPIPLIPLEDFARAPHVLGIAISPDGKRLAELRTIDGRGSIVLREADSQNVRVLARNPDRSIDNVHWSSDGRYLFYLQDAGGDEGFHLFKIDPRAPRNPPKDLTPFKGVAVELVRQPRSSGSSVVITLNRRDPQWPDAYRLDLATGKLTEIQRNDGGITNFFADSTGTIVAAESIRPTGELQLLVPTETRAWKTIYTASVDERFKTLLADPSGRTVYVRSNRGADRDQLLLINLVSGAFEILPTPECAPFDVEDVVVAEALDAVLCSRERALVVPRSPSYSRAISAVSRTAGNDAGLHVESAVASGAQVIFYADRSDRSGRFILADNRTVRDLGLSRPWLEHRRLVASRPVWIKARDGLPLLAYVTRPAGRSGPAPTIIAIHGGPWSRDTGGFEATTQLLANRGYAVVQVNFRGSTGLGKSLFEAGVRQFGRAMSDDIDDAAAWAVQQGIAAPGQICLMGGSYGGYATLSLLARRGSTYRCGVDYAGPVDLVTLVEAFPPSWAPFLPRSWYRFVGRPAVRADRADMQARSPLRAADRISAPLLVFQGANDPRVTQAQSDAIVCSLRQRSIPVDYLLASNEGHSFANEETGLAVNRATELFLDRHLGGRAQAQVSAPAGRALAVFRSAGSAVRCKS